VQLPPGTGVALAAAVDPERCAIGDTVTITATVTADGVPVTGAIARAKVTHPDGATTTDLVLVDDGQADGAVATTQPYPLEDFAPSPRFTVGGTVTGLVGTGLELELSAEGPPGPPPTTTLRPRNGSFTFFPRLVGGNPYEVRVKTQPTNPIQVCTITNASGTIEDANVTNIEAVCA
jgi:hypothetical protein